MGFALDGAGLKLEWANKKIETIGEDWLEFRDSKPYALEAEHRKDTRDLIFKFRTSGLPPFLPVQIGELIHNLHSALDHLTWELVILETGAPSRSTQLQFPVFLDATGYVKRADQKLAGVGAKARAIIEELQPFRTGEGASSPLWMLYQLSVWDKHKSIPLVGMSADQIQIGPLPSQEIEESEGCGSPVILKDHTPIGRIRFKPGVQITKAALMAMNAHVTYEVAFEEPEAVRGMEMMTVLNACGERVAQILQRFSDECGALK